MKIGLISNPRHRAGDRMEFLLLRAAHWLTRFEPADLLLVTGELTAENAAPEPGFLDAFYASLARRKSELPVIFPGSETPVTVCGEVLSPAALTGRIREAAGAVPDFEAFPFEYLVAEFDGGALPHVERRALVEPELAAQVTDFHIHTSAAYCSENMRVDRALEMAKLSGLGGVSFAEHSGQLYFESDDYWNGRSVWRTRGTPEGCRAIDRSDEYRAELRTPGCYRHGFELDVDRNGDVLLSEKERPLAEVRLGAVHFLVNRSDPREASREFLFYTESLLKYGVDILAHPFRIFAWAGLEKPAELFAPVADLLAHYGVAAEVNFHQNQPEHEFFDLCLRKGVKLSLGSDSHNLYEVGFFLPHFRFLRELGVAGKLDEVIFR